MTTPRRKHRERTDTKGGRVWPEHRGRPEKRSPALRRWERILELWSVGTPIKDIAHDLKVTEDHVRRVTKNEAFQEDFKALRKERLERAMAALETSGPAAAQVLTREMLRKENTPQVKIKAATAILDRVQGLEQRQHVTAEAEVDGLAELVRRIEKRRAEGDGDD